MEDGEADVFVFFGDAGVDERASDGYAAAAGAEGLLAFAMDVEAEELAVFGVGAEDGADGVVGADLFETDLHAVDVAVINLGAVDHLGDVAFGFGEDVEESGFESGAGFAEELARELDDAAGVGDDLHGLDAGDLVEEPAAGGVHELGVAFELEEFEAGDAFGFGEFARGLLREEVEDGGGGAGWIFTAKDDLDVGVARGPEVFEEGLGELLGEGGGGVAEVVEGFAERGAPFLVPAGLAAVAAAVGAPAFDAVGAGPGGVFGDFGLPFRRKFFEEFAVVGEAGLVPVFDVVHAVGEGHFAVLVMVAVAFAVGGYVGDLRDFGIAGRGRVEAGEEAFAEVFAAVEEAFEGDGAGGGADGGVGGLGPGDLLGFDFFGG